MSSDYRFVIDSSFQPFSMQEQLMPFTMYKDAYEKEEERYIDLQNKADNFSYLANTLPEGSKARDIYEGYVNDLRKYGDDFGKNGLSISNRRGLTAMRRRYQGEIGRLDKADTELQKEIDRRVTLNANDPTTLYATDNLSIDDFLDRKRPNDYSVSGQKLYERGVQIGASDSSRIWSSPQVQQVNKYYQSLYQTSGRDPRVLAQWRANLESIPELNDSLNATLKEFGVTDNLTGSSLERARESVINGIINGSTYKRADNFQRDLGVMSAAENAQNQRSIDSINLQAASAGMRKDDNGNWVWSEKIDPAFQKAKAVAEIKKDNSISHAGASYDNRNADTIMVGGNSGKYYRWTNDDTTEHSGYDPLENTSPTVVDPATLLDSTGAISNDVVRNAIGNNNLGDYEISVIPKGSTKIDGSGWFSDDKTDEDIYIIKPRVPKRSAANNNSSSLNGGNGTNDEPQ